MMTKLSTTNEASIRHQQLLSQVLRPATFSLLEKVKVIEGSRALCLNCGEGDVVFHLSGLVGSSGTVLGIDWNRENIQTAQQLASIKKIGNATFSESEQHWQSNGQLFDLIHFSLPLLQFFDPAVFIEEIQAQLMPGGVAVFEVIDFSGFNGTPKNFAFERFLDLYAAFVRSQWNEASIATKLNWLLYQSGFQQVQHQYVAPAFLKGPAKNLPSLTLKCIKEELLCKKLSSEEELLVLLLELKDFEQKAHSLISLPGIHQIWGQKA